MVLVRCPLQKKVESKIWRRNYWTFCRQEKLLAESLDSVNVSVDSTELKKKDIHL